MAERKKLEVTILQQNFEPEEQARARNNINAASVSDISSLSAKTVTKIKGDECLSVASARNPDGTVEYSLSVTAEPTDTRIQGKDGVSASRAHGDEGLWFVGLSGKYLSANALNNLSGNWESSYNTLKANSADWLKEDALAGLATKSELNTASSVLTAQTNYLSGVINNKLDTSAFNTYTANADITPYSGIDPILVKDHKISLTAEYALSADVYNKDEIDDKIETLEQELAKLGFYVCKSNEVDNDGVPDETVLESEGKLSTSKVYLVKVDTAPTPDQYKEWIWDDNIWTCIGDTTISLDGYATETWVKANFSAASALSAEFMKYLNKTDFNTYSADVKTQIDAKLDTNTFDAWSAHAFDDYAKTADVNEKFDQTSAWAKDTFQPKGEYVSASDFNDLVSLVNDIVDDVTELDNTKLDTSAFNNYSAHALDNYYNKSEVDELVDDAIDELSATVDDEYAKKTDIHEYTAGPNIEINDYEVSGRDWTPELDEKADITYVEEIAETLANGIAKKLDTSAFNDYSAHALDDYYKKSETSAKEEIQTALDKKQDNLTEEQLSAISSVSAIQAISGNWVTSAANVITDPDLAYFLVKDENTSKWSGVDLSTLGKTYEVLSTDNDLLKITSSVDGNNTTYTLSAKDWSDELDEKVDETTFNDELQDIAEQFVELSATVSSDYVKKGEIPEPVFYDISAKYAKAQSGTYNDKDYYFISGAEIIGNNGVSAEYDPNTNSWEVGLEDYENIGFAKYNTSANVYTGTAVFDGYSEVLNLNSDKIALESDELVLQPGLYHVDLQCLMSVTGNDNNYYSTVISTVPAAASITQIIDASYAHNETIDLSFDIRITDADTTLDISVDDFQIGGTYTITNLNIHEIITMPSKIEGNAGNYQAGEAIDITNDTISVKYEPASGIGLTNDYKLFVKLGEGLKFDTSGAAAGSLSLSNIAQDVINTVDKMANDLDEKVTVSMPFNCIVGRGVPTDFETGKNRMIGQLFSVAINNDLRVGDTVIEVFGTDTAYTQSYPIFGLYEYDFDYPRYIDDDPTQGISGYGRTLWVCDTGPVTCTTGKMQFPVTHLNPDCAELKASRVYYATIAIAGNAGAGPQLAGCAGYGQTFNANPVFTTDAQDITTVDFTNTTGTLSGTGFWQNNYHEMPAAYRFFMQIRNKTGA